MYQFIVLQYEQTVGAISRTAAVVSIPATKHYTWCNINNFPVFLFFFCQSEDSNKVIQLFVSFRYLRHIISHHITTYHIISHHITLYHIISQHITLYHIISHHITPYHIISLHITPYHIISHHITLYHIISHHITSYHITYVIGLKSTNSLLSI
jgi:hypothetical protein